MDDDELKPAPNGPHDRLNDRRGVTRLRGDVLGRPVEWIGTPLLIIPVDVLISR